MRGMLRCLILIVRNKQIHNSSGLVIGIGRQVIVIRPEGLKSGLVQILSLALPVAELQWEFAQGSPFRHNLLFGIRPDTERQCQQYGDDVNTCEMPNAQLICGGRRQPGPRLSAAGSAMRLPSSFFSNRPAPANTPTVTR